MKKKKNYQNKNKYIYIQVDLVPASFMELQKYKNYLKIAQLIIFHYL